MNVKQIVLTHRRSSYSCSSNRSRCTSSSSRRRPCSEYLVKRKRKFNTQIQGILLCVRVLIKWVQNIINTYLNEFLKRLIKLYQLFTGDYLIHF